MARIDAYADIVLYQNGKWNYPAYQGRDSIEGSNPKHHPNAIDVTESDVFYDYDNNVNRYYHHPEARKRTVKIPKDVVNTIETGDYIELSYKITEYNPENPENDKKKYDFNVLGGVFEGDVYKSISSHNSYTFNTSGGTDKLYLTKDFTLYEEDLYLTITLHVYGSKSDNVGSKGVTMVCNSIIIKKPGYKITFNVNGGSTSISSQTVSTISLPSPGSKAGYTFDGWYNGSTRIGGAGDSWTPTADATITAKWKPRTDTKYVVKHQLMNVNGSGYTLKDTETLKGTTDTSVTPATKTYTGFTAPSKQTVNIDANGSRVVTYSYSRNKYTFTLGSNASVYSHGINTSGSSASGSYYYGATITLKASPKAGYTWSKWSDENTSTSRTFTMPANNLTITPQANLITYNIRYNLFKGSVSGNPATYTVETPTFTLKNPTLAGFTFLGWTSPANREAKTAYQIPKGSTGDIVISANWVSGKISDDSLNTQGGNGNSDSGNSDNTDPDNARSKNTKTQHNNFKIG